MIVINYWWVTRPKRDLKSVPDVLGVFAEQALGQVWSGQRDSHLSLEDALEQSGLKRKGDRRDQTGGGARTYFVWVMSLGLLFEQAETGRTCLTLAGEAIMNGESPVSILANQVIKYQFPSTFSLRPRVGVNRRFRIHPFYFLLRLLLDKRIGYLTQSEIARIIIVEAENESDKCYEYIVSRILQYREQGDECLQQDFFDAYKPSKKSRGNVKPDHSFSHLEDTANTFMNWLEYTQMIVREDGKMRLLTERIDDAQKIVDNPPPFIARPEEPEYFQRRYGLDPKHCKDTRNLTGSQVVTPRMIAEHRVKQAFIGCALKEPIGGITQDLVDKLAEQTGIARDIVVEVLEKNFPHGSIGAFMTSYFEMAFKGHEECRDLEQATAKIFENVFGFNSTWLGSAWSGKEVPDVLLLSDEAGYQAIIDTKAYSKYELPTTQRDRMIHHYLPDIHTYSDSNHPIGFFSYIAGGFSNTIATPLKKIVDATGVNGSAMPITTFIKMIEKHNDKPFSHEAVRQIFSVNRKVELGDII